jgi:hypothetical protein
MKTKAVGATVGRGDGLGVGVGLGLGVGDGEGLGVGSGVGPGVGLTLGFRTGLAAGVTHAHVESSNPGPQITAPATTRTTTTAKMARRIGAQV